MESFEEMGYFWLPEAPEHKVPGVLRFDPEEGGSLSLIDTIDDTWLPFGGKGAMLRVLGVAGGKGYTLEDCFETLRQYGMVGPARQQLYVNRILEGAHFEAEEAFTFDRAATGLDGLVYWMQLSGLTDSWESASTSNIKEITVRARKLEDLSTGIPGGKLAITHSWGVQGDSIIGRHVTQDFFVNISLDELVPVTQILEMLGDVQDLVSIGLGRTAAFDQVRLYRPDVSRGNGEDKFREPLRLITRWQAKKKTYKRAPMAHDMPFTYGHLDGVEGVRRWMETAEKRRGLLGTVMGTFYSERMYDSDRLLNRVAALEALHRQRFYPGQKALRSRLEELAEYAGNPFVRQVGHVSKWCSVIKDERNNVAHHLGRNVITGQGAIHHLAESAYWLFVLCLLREAEMPEVIFDSIGDNREFLWVSETLSRLLA